MVWGRGSDANEDSWESSSQIAMLSGDVSERSTLTMAQRSTRLSLYGRKTKENRMMEEVRPWHMKGRVIGGTANSPSLLFRIIERLS